jgi:hypothetical protein
MADIEAAQQAADEHARAEAEKRAGEQAMSRREQAIAAREQAQQEIIAKRENMMALAALLLAAAAVAGGAAVIDHSKREARHARRLGGLAGVLLLGAVIAFALRPGFGSVDEAPGNTAGNETAQAAAPEGTGDRLCRFDAALSRATVSDTTDVPFHWSQDGCLNGQTQFVPEQGHWSRIFVPAGEASISLRSFEPVIGRYRTDKYLVDAETADRARSLREQVNWSGCTADPARLAELARMQADIRLMLPTQPNERLVYRCTAAGAGAEVEAGSGADKPAP